MPDNIHSPPRLGRREHQVFPRGASWLAIAAGLSFGVVGVTPFVTAGGALSLEGWFAGWIPGSMFFTWTAVTTYCMVKDVRFRQRHTAASVEPAATGAI